MIPISLIHKITGKLRITGQATDYWSHNYNFWFFRVLGTRIKYINTTKPISTGFILANHRSFTDFAIDSLITRNIIVSRHMATLSVLPGSILSLLDGRAIVINRTQSRTEIFQKIIDYMKTHEGPILFFPEGTRLQHTHLNSIDETFLKPGLLKSVYEYKKFPVQLQLSNNKEHVFNEKKGILNYGVTVNVFLSEPIYPEDFGSFDDFFKEICKQWFENWIVPSTI